MSTLNEIICYPNLLPFETTTENVDQFMAGMAAAGVNRVQVNHLPDLMHPELLNQPDNVYLWFANFGPPLDLFVSSDLNRGLYPEMYLERNRRTLLRFAESARRHGIRPLLYLCEPRFVPERFFQRHPNLRGPRVDNPTCSTSPIYALCTDLPEVQEHYREMMAAMMELVPDLSLISLFTSDSGAGFDYNPDTYAGANGAGFNQRIPLEKRVVNFLSILLEEGRRKVSDFTVNLTSGFSPEDRKKILDIAPDGVVGSVQGLYDWEGGLEEMWGYHQALWGIPEAKWNIRNLDREAAAKDRFDDMKERYDIAATNGRKPIVHAELPTTDYPRPLRYTPHPFETIRVVRDLQRIGVERVSLWGVINSPDLVPYDVNMAAFKAAVEDADATADAIIEAIAEDWVGEKHTQTLVTAWRQCDQVWCRRPMWNHGGLPKPMWLGPIVPDLAAVTDAETAYYRTVALDDLERIKGFGSFVPHEADERNRDHVIDKIYNTETLPGLENAMNSLRDTAQNADAKVADIMHHQADHIELGWRYQISHRNWYEAGRHLAPGKNPTLTRTMQEIVDEEIANTEATIELIDGRIESFIRAYPSDHMTYEFGRSVPEQLRQRVQIMKQHRNDPARALGESLDKMKMYEGKE